MLSNNVQANGRDLDDLIIVSEDFPSHLEVLIRIASQFRKAKLTLNVSKSHFCVTTVKYLGYVIGHGGITTYPEKVSAITNWPIPRNLKQVRGFLGLTGWYLRFVQNFATETFPLTEVLKCKKKFVWTHEAQDAFEKLKKNCSHRRLFRRTPTSQKILSRLRR